MQSVFKLPLTIYAFHLVEQGKFTLDQPIRFLKSDRFSPHTYSPLQDKYPDADVDVPLRELLRLSSSLSDNAAADIIVRIVGGPAAVDGYIKTLGIEGFHLQDGEHELHRDPAAQYRNWFEPAGAVQLLRRLSGNSPLNPEHTALLLTWLAESPTGLHRIKGNLPPGTVVMHKTGTSGTSGGVTAATNDMGLITLPDGRRLAIAVFVTDSSAGETVRDAVIARIAKAAYQAAI
jgi:beta-lactamase class A